MGYCTIPITLDEAKTLIDGTLGEVVSASKCLYFKDMKWMKDVVKAELKDDSFTIFFKLFNEDFVEYCLIRE